MDEQLAEMDGARRAINLKQLGKRGGPQGGWGPACCVPRVCPNAGVDKGARGYVHVTRPITNFALVRVVPDGLGEARGAAQSVAASGELPWATHGPHGNPRVFQGPPCPRCSPADKAKSKKRQARDAKFGELCDELQLLLSIVGPQEYELPPRRGPTMGTVRPSAGAGHVTSCLEHAAAVQLCRAMTYGS